VFGRASDGDLENKILNALIGLKSAVDTSRLALAHASLTAGYQWSLVGRGKDIS
jgi:hypothetical protein